MSLPLHPNIDLCGSREGTACASSHSGSLRKLVDAQHEVARESTVRGFPSFEHTLITRASARSTSALRAAFR